ncbi:hypothetical protein FRB94_009548 [Tulasnella sp. JGI-2019a]|nr:hypothetical protein FRB94_009548 [Tulasnella sp. JGI-2019a]
MHPVLIGPETRNGQETLSSRLPLEAERAWATGIFYQPLDLQDWLTDDCRMPATFAEVEAITIITFESIDPIRYLDIVGESKLEPQERILETVARYTLTLCGCTYEAQ